MHHRTVTAQKIEPKIYVYSTVMYVHLYSRLENGHRIIDDRIEKSVKGRQIWHNLH